MEENMEYEFTFILPCLNEEKTISHKIGVKFLSGFANLIFHTPIKDYHCGLRAYKTESIKKLNLTQKGMEYASEMIIVAKIKNLKLLEVSTNIF